MPGPDVRAVALVSDGLRAGWFASELAAFPIVLELARSVPQAVAWLTDDRPPRPQILFVDFDPLTPIDVLQLHAIRERGWFGVIIGFGNVARDLRTSLNIECVLENDTAGVELREIVAKVGLNRPTSRMRTLTRPRSR